MLNTHEKDWKVGKEIRLLPGRFSWVLGLGLGDVGEGKTVGGFEKGRAKHELP